MRRVIARDRRTPGRADGCLFFTLRWPSGDVQERSSYCRHLDPMIRLFRDRLRYVPQVELQYATAKFYATVRKAAGGRKRVLLASWAGNEPIEAFFASAQAAWLALPKEEEDQEQEVPLDDLDVEINASADMVRRKS